MRFGIEGHCSRTAFGFQYLNDRQFVGPFFFRNRSGSIAARRERELRSVIKRTAIDASANRNSIDDFSSFGIEHHHHFVVAAREQTMMLGIQSKSAWSFARRKRPVRDDFMLIRIDHRDFALVFDVAVNAPRCFIYRRELRSSFERNRR